MAGARVCYQKYRIAAHSPNPAIFSFKQDMTGTFGLHAERFTNAATLTIKKSVEKQWLPTVHVKIFTPLQV